ncbi:MAG TPA: RNA polymerase sigma factor [Fredinandcohnia sp.]|nr:RNA polymerase sigma factor [Fredinandcohnia sp.]
MSLLERCQAGDASAWNQLFRERSGQVYRWAVLLGLNPADAEEAAQEVFAIAARRIDTCHADDALGSWLFQITRRVVANARRSGWLKRALFGEKPLEPAFGPAESPETAKEIAVRACLAKIPREQAEVLVLMEVEGHTREEVADILGLPPGTVASRARLGRKAFLRHWQEMQEAAGDLALSWGEK